MEKITGIILAGGKSSRMGEEKGLVTFRGKALIEYPIALFEKLGFEIIIIANDSSYEKYGYPVFKDLFENKGPLAGVFTGLKSSQNEWNAVITCDTPLIEKKIYDELIQNRKNARIVLAQYANKIQPLTALYNNNTSKKMYSNIKEERLRIRDLRHKFLTNYVEFDEKYSDSFINMNTKQDIQLWS